MRKIKKEDIKSDAKIVGDIIVLFMVFLVAAYFIWLTHMIVNSLK